MFAVIGINCSAQKQKTKAPIINQEVKTKTANTNVSTIIPAAERLNVYLPLLKGKRVAVFANHTAMVGNTHLVDTMQKLGVNIKIAFGPEHGFRGNAPDGAKIETTIDKTTGIPIVSLYGQKNKPSKEDLKDIDVMVYDIQDVGTRFYTFISSMQLFMEAAIENNIPLIILDRPNPNGFYVDGPVLDPKFKSFVGMQPIPVVYGMTIGEYANMILQEKWLSKEANEAISKNHCFAVCRRSKIFPADSYTMCELYTPKQICFTGKALTKFARNPIHLLVCLQLLF